MSDIMKKVWKKYKFHFMSILIFITFFIFTIKLSKYLILTDFKINLLQFYYFIMDSCSIIFTLILAFIVYKQEQKIRSLELNNYTPYIGISSIYRKDFTINEIISNKSNSGEKVISKIYSNEEVVNFSVFNISNEITKSKNYIIPLNIIVQNKLVLNEIKITTLDITPTNNKTDVEQTNNTFKYNFDNEKNYLALSTYDKVEIPFLVYIFYDMDVSINGFNIDMAIETTDSSGKIWLFKLESKVVKEDDEFFLVSSYTKLVS